VIDVIVLAAGQGTRMRSSLPKVLHPIGGVAMLEHVVRTASALPGVKHVHVVYGHGGEQVRQQLAHLRVNWVEQAQQLGTGHAVMQAMPALDNARQVLVLYGDVPLISAATLSRLLVMSGDNSLALLTAQLPDPAGYGRIVRNTSGQVQRIVEQKDARPDELSIREINTGILAAPAACLKSWLDKLNNKNAQGEYYLTDVIAMAVADGVPVSTVEPQVISEIQGVNDRSQLAELERAYQSQQAKRLMLAGITLLDPARFDLRGQLVHGQDIRIDANVILEGVIHLGNRVRIGTGVVLKDSEIGDDVIIEPFTVIDNARIEAHCHICPYERLSPE
jgi:bifunctional UDP-N-acetylglucosamine pyrophosphorylase/glucosamine-1-phosphate N-acetyltransferase